MPEHIKIPTDMELLDYIVSFIESTQDSDNSSENHYKILKDEKTCKKMNEEIKQKAPARNGMNLILNWSHNGRKTQLVATLTKKEVFIHQIRINSALIFQCTRFGSENTYIFQV